MRIEELVDVEVLNRLVSDGYISAKKDRTQTIYNYTPKGAYSKMWDVYEMRACRGLIVNDDGSVAARPWEKFFNHNQPEAGVVPLDAAVTVTDKVDGSLGVLYVDSAGLPSVATRGSFISEMAVHGTEFLRRSGFEWDTAYTPLVEIVYPQNRIVIDYGDRDELVLLGAVEVDTGRYLDVDEAALTLGWDGAVTELFSYATFAEALAAPPRDNAEGLCIRVVGENRIVKLKQQDYLILHKAIFGLSEKSVWSAVSSGATLEEFCSPLPDEVHGWVERHWASFVERSEKVVAAHRAWFDEFVGEAMGKEAALVIKSAPSVLSLDGLEVKTLSGMLFSMMNRRGGLHLMALRTLEPRGSGEKPILDSEG